MLRVMRFGNDDGSGSKKLMKNLSNLNYLNKADEREKNVNGKIVETGRKTFSFITNTILVSF